jgi:hypothetical protein
MYIFWQIYLILWSKSLLSVKYIGRKLPCNNHFGILLYGHPIDTPHICLSCSYRQCLKIENNILILYNDKYLNKLGLLISKSLVTVSKNKTVPAKLLNPGNEPIRIQKGSILAHYTGLSPDDDIMKLRCVFRSFSYQDIRTCNWCIFVRIKRYYYPLFEVFVKVMTKNFAFLRRQPIRSDVLAWNLVSKQDDVKPGRYDLGRIVLCNSSLPNCLIQEMSPFVFKRDQFWHTIRDYLRMMI